VAGGGAYCAGAWVGSPATLALRDVCECFLGLAFDAGGAVLACGFSGTP
jgi:hypothetical protein